MLKQFKYILILALLLMLSGCYDRLVSWSPDGRYVLYTMNDENRLWQFDTKTGKTEEVNLILQPSKNKPSEEITLKTKGLLGCRYFENQSGILIYTEDKEFYLRNNKTGYFELIAQDFGSGFYVSDDEKGIYYIKENKNNEKKDYSLIEYRDGKNMPIFTSNIEIGYPCASQDGGHILFSTGDSLSIYDIKEKKSSVIISDKRGKYYFPRWVSKNEIVYIFVNNADDGEFFSKDVGALCRLSIDLVNKKQASTPTILKKNQLAFFPYSIVNFTYALQATNKTKPSDTLMVTEPVVIASVETQKEFYETNIISIKTGNTIWQSDSIASVFSPSLSPDGEKLAYLSGIDDYTYLEVQYLKTGKRKIAWHNESEKLFAEAETLKQANEFQMAIDKYDLITRQYPDSKIEKAAYFNMAMLQLKPEAFDLDATYDSLIKINKQGDIPSILWNNLWRPEDRIAVDPAEDWIQTYGTEASQKGFGFNTDQTRDLKGLWMRDGKEWLYIRIDYESSFDLTGQIFQDTMLLFDYDTPETGSRQITELTQWDKTADRKVLMRHWYESGEMSQYDLEILNDKDEIIHKYLVSGFAPPDNPYFRFYRFNNEGTNYMVLAISHKILGLCKAKNINIQACTFKGGIESFKGLETPRFDTIKNQWDVADCFGKENNLERIKADKAKTPDKPIVIKGFAGTLKTESVCNQK